jgi:hypothetical protein
MKLITFSLWGTDPKYLRGATKNAELANTIYPGWTCRFYTGQSVPFPIIHELKSFENTEVVEKDGWGDWTSMYWRFEAASENGVEVMISRDTDSRLSYRERAAVDEWLSSDKGFHIMRDHPWHGFPVLGGMWGAKAGTISNIQELINDFNQTNEYGTDYKFFAEMVVPRLNDNIMVHDEFFDRHPFPVERQNYEFVGQVFDENEETIEEHVLALKGALV